MRVVILGAGIAGHTAALLLRRKLSVQHEVVVVTPNALWNWIPSNIWVGTGFMKKEQVTFELAPIYRRAGITYHQAKATELHPEGDATHAGPYVVAESTAAATLGERVDVPYDYLINATGPKLNFEATPGLGPTGHTHSVCTFDHATETAAELDGLVRDMQAGAQKTFVVGTGHGTCTCQGAAFEYAFNLEFELRRRGVRDRARIIYLTNEAALADFGVDGMHLSTERGPVPGQQFAESLFAERGIDWILGAHVQRVEAGRLYYEDLDGSSHELAFDLAMLLPPFRGHLLKAFDRKGNEITETLFTAAGFMKVDADYSVKAYEAWRPADWPRTYQTSYKNVFAVGIAFAPPHQISRPRKNPNGTMIAPAPPRTGMPSAVMARAVALSIVDMINSESSIPTHTASMAELGAACVASAGAHALRGTAASMTMFPIVPDYQRYPHGRHPSLTTGELGLAGHWIKHLLHHAFIYKAKARPLWWLIPE